MVLLSVMEEFKFIRSHVKDLDIDMAAFWHFVEVQLHNARLEYSCL